LVISESCLGSFTALMDCWSSHIKHSFQFPDIFPDDCSGSVPRPDIFAGALKSPRSRSLSQRQPVRRGRGARRESKISDWSRFYHLKNSDRRERNDSVIQQIFVFTKSCHSLIIFFTLFSETDIDVCTTAFTISF